MKSRSLRVGIVGYGRIAELAHAPAWMELPSADIVAVADTCPVRRATALAALPLSRAYESCTEMLKVEKLDILDVCTPPSDHAPSIIAGCAAQVGRIVCEKPLTAAPEEYRTIAAAQSASRSQVFTVNSWLQSDLHRLVAAELRRGTIGEILHVRLRTLRPDCALGISSWRPRWRTDPMYAGGGIVLDHGWHQLYLMANWIGKRPMSVNARLETVKPLHLPVEDVATLDLQFPAATGRIELSWAAPARANDGEIVGTKGSIDIEDDCLVVHSGSGEETRPYGERLSDSSYHPEWFLALFNQIVGDGSAVTGQANLREAKMLLTRAHPASTRRSAAHAGQGLPRTASAR